MWTVVVICAVLIAGAAGALYWYVTKEETTGQANVVERTAEERELESVKKDIDAAADLDTAEVDDAVKEIESVDMTGV